MPNDGFAEVQQHLESITSELNNARDPDRRKLLLREMSRLLGEAERISSQPPKMSHKLGEPLHLKMDTWAIKLIPECTRTSKTAD
jgi:hypothetical protein